MIQTKFRVNKPAMARFVRKGFVPGEYVWCEQSAEDARYDVAQGTCNAEDLPPTIRKKCNEYYGSFYACEWPM